MSDKSMKNKLKELIHHLKQQEFIQWYYSPEQSGGKRDKCYLYNMVQK